MKPEYLKEACEAAGAVIHTVYEMEPGVIEWMARWGEGSSSWNTPHDNPCLAAYVANLLVDRVWNEHGMDWAAESGHPDSCRVDFSNQPTAHGTTVTARGRRAQVTDCTIATAMVVLGCWAEDKAREALS